MSKFQKLYEEFYDAFERTTFRDKIYVEVYKNPSRYEVGKVIQMSNYKMGCRGLCNSITGDVFVFNDDVLHSYASSKINSSPLNIHLQYDNIKKILKIWKFDEASGKPLSDILLTNINTAFPDSEFKIYG